MTKSVKTSAYEKKYKDKKTNEWKSIKIDLARVGDRLFQFREDNPRSKVITKHHFEANGTTTMKSFMWKNRKDVVYFEGTAVLDSADAVGIANDITVRNENGRVSVENKAMEKLETVANGRALASLGYMKDGQVASTEEMEQFEAYKEEQLEQAVAEAVYKIENATDIDNLKETFMSLGNLIAHSKVQDAKDKRKKELQNES